MTDTPLPPEDADEALAAEYVLGVLDLPERTAAAARIAHDPAFAARVSAWETRLSALNDGYAEAPPPPETLARVEARLFPKPARPRLRLFWAWGTTAAAVLALGLWFALAPARPDYIATLAAPEAGLTFQAQVAGDSLTITRTAGPAPDATYALELWVIVGEAPPRSLGLLTEARQTIALPGAAPGQTLAISREPPGGSPGDAPTGPILALASLSPA